MTMTMKLKPQWALKLTETGPLLLSENLQHPHGQAFTPLLQKLEAGVDPSTLTDEEFEQVELLNASGFLDTGDSGHAFVWELAGYADATVQDQLSNVHISLHDLSKNGVGASLLDSLIDQGLQVHLHDPDYTGITALTIVFADSYLDLPDDMPGTWLPIIVNRLKIWSGPMQFPETVVKVKTRIQANIAYLERPRYDLPLFYLELQRAYLQVVIPQILGMSRLEYVNHFIEFNMMKCTTAVYPV